VSVEVTLSKINRKFEQEIRTNIENSVNNFFNLQNWEFGQGLRDNDLIKSLSSVKQAEGFEIVFTTDYADNSGSSVSTKFFEIIRPGSIEVAFMYE
jgi:hypothetical protein